MTTKSRFSFFCLAMLLLSLLAIPAAGENWPNWRGPRLDGTSLAEGLPTTWSATENVRWRLEMPGPGPSTPIVWDDKILLTTADGEDLLLMAVDRAGKELWRQKISTGNYSKWNGETNAVSPSPSTDGKHVWVMTGTGVFSAFDLDGKKVWQTSLVEKYGELNYFFGHASTPLLHGDRLYVLLLHTDAQLVLAFDKLTGQEVWRHERVTDATKEGLHSYASPVLWEHGDQQQLIIHGGDHATGHSLADGKEIWRVGGFNPKENYNPMFRFVATPVVHQQYVIAPSAKNGPVVAVDISKAKGNVTGGEAEVWRMDKGTPDVPSPLVHDGVVYLSRENGMLMARDLKSGEELYVERVHSRPHRGSPVYADGKVFLMGIDGTVSVVKAGRSYELLAQNKIDEHLAASLAIADGTIYLRTFKALYAIAPPPAKTGP